MVWESNFLARADKKRAGIASIQTRRSAILAIIGEESESGSIAMHDDKKGL